MRMFKMAGSSALLLVAALPALATAQWRDVTPMVKQQTDLAKKIAEACRRHCKGNQREGRLLSVYVRPRGEGVYDVTARADLRNKHNTGKILGVGGGIGYDYTVKIHAVGVLDTATCELRIDRIAVKDDQLGLSPLARGEEGKRHHIENCRQLV